MLTPLAMAVVLWFVIDSLAHALCVRLRVLPSWLATPTAIGVVIVVAALMVGLVVSNVSELASRGEAYQARLDAFIAEGHRWAHIGGAPPTVRQILSNLDLPSVLTAIAEAAQALTAEAVMTLVFLVFMFPAAAAAPNKLDHIFPTRAHRERARKVITAIEQATKSYFWVQMVGSFITSALVFASLSAVGLNNALYWAVLMFFLNFIPVIGTIIAIALPVVFALMQFADPLRVLATVLGAGAWPFLIGNFVMPRLTGRSLNLSPLVVLLALAFWSTIWGVTGAFLAAPLSVMLMIVLAQFPETRALAILMSADAQPLVAAEGGEDGSG